MSHPLKKISTLFADVRIGGTPSRGQPRFFGGPYHWVSIKDMYGQPMITRTAETLTDEGIRSSNCKLVKQGSLLFSFKLTVGRVAIAGCDLYTNEAIAAFDSEQAQSAGVDLDYLALVLPIAAAADNTKNSMGVALLNKEKILNLESPCPPPGAQRQIAARLQAQLAEVDTARQAAQAQVRDAELLCTKLVDSALLACTQWQHIGAVAKLQSGYAFKSEDFKTSGVRLLRNTNILPGKVYWDDAVYIDTSEVVRYPSYVLAAGDILISLDRPLIASGIKVARVSTDDLPALLLQRVGRFVLKPGLVDPDFLFAYLQSSRFIAAISGHDQSLGVPHISPGQVEAVEFPLLPIAEQYKLASRLKSQLVEVTAIAQAAAAQLAEIDRLPQRILAQAFAGSA